MNRVVAVITNHSSTIFTPGEQDFSPLWAHSKTEFILTLAESFRSRSEPNCNRFTIASPSQLKAILCEMFHSKLKRQCKVTYITSRCCNCGVFLFFFIILLTLTNIA